MAEEGDRERPRGPEGGAANEPGAEQCPLCRARLPTRPTAPAVDAWTLPQAPTPTMRRRARRRDLRAKTARVERTVTSMAQPETKHPRAWRRVAGPALVFGGLVTATGLVLIPATFVVGWFTLVAGIILLTMGVFLRYARLGGQK